MVNARQRPDDSDRPRSDSSSAKVLAVSLKKCGQGLAIATAIATLLTGCGSGSSDSNRDHRDSAKSSSATDKTGSAAPKSQEADDPFDFAIPEGLSHYGFDRAAWNAYLRHLVEGHQISLDELKNGTAYDKSSDPNDGKGFDSAAKLQQGWGEIGMSNCGDIAEQGADTLGTAKWTPGSKEQLDEIAFYRGAEILCNSASE